jgi:hypothetical protein
MKLSKSVMAVSLVFLFITLVLWFIGSLNTILYNPSWSLLIPPAIILSFALCLVVLLIKRTGTPEDDGYGMFGFLRNTSDNLKTSDSVVSSPSVLKNNVLLNVIILIAAILGIGPCVFFLYKMIFP